MHGHGERKAFSEREDPKACREMLRREKMGCGLLHPVLEPVFVTRVLRNRVEMLKAQHARVEWSGEVNGWIAFHIWLWALGLTCGRTGRGPTDQITGAETGGPERHLPHSSACRFAPN